MHHCIFLCAFAQRRKELSDIIPKLQVDIETKEKTYNKAKAVLDAALNELRTAKISLSNENYKFDTEISQQERFLYESYNPEIDSAITFFRDKLIDLRRPGQISFRRINVERNIFTEMKTLKVEINKSAILGAMRYCMAAIKMLEDLKLSPAFDIQKIQALKDGIPSIDVFEEVSGEKPLPGLKVPNPRDLLPSDDQIVWEMEKINEKFKKIMRK